jgi:hypothetical protein
MEKKNWAEVAQKINATPALAAWLTDPRFSEDNKTNWADQFTQGKPPFVRPGEVHWDTGYLPEEVAELMPYNPGINDLAQVGPDGRTFTNYLVKFVPVCPYCKAEDAGGGCCPEAIDEFNCF